MVRGERNANDRRPEKIINNASVRCVCVCVCVHSPNSPNDRGLVDFGRDDLKQRAIHFKMKNDNNEVSLVREPKKEAKIGKQRRV